MKLLATETVPYLLESRSGRFSPVMLLVSTQGYDGIHNDEHFNCHVTVWSSDKAWTSFVIRADDSGDGDKIANKLLVKVPRIKQSDADLLMAWCCQLVHAAHDPDCDRTSQRLFID